MLQVDQLVPKVLINLLTLKGQQVHKVLQVLEDLRVQRVHLDHQVLVVHKVSKELLVLLVSKE